MQPCGCGIEWVMVNITADYSYTVIKIDMSCNTEFFAN